MLHVQDPWLMTRPSPELEEEWGQWSGLFLFVSTWLRPVEMAFRAPALSSAAVSPLRSLPPPLHRPQVEWPDWCLLCGCGWARTQEGQSSPWGLAHPSPQNNALLVVILVRFCHCNICIFALSMCPLSSGFWTKNEGFCYHQWPSCQCPWKGDANGVLADRENPGNLLIYAGWSFEMKPCFYLPPVPVFSNRGGIVNDGHPHNGNQEVCTSEHNLCSTKLCPSLESTKTMARAY